MKVTFTASLIALSLIAFGQDRTYEPSSENPYGKLNPAAAPGVADFDPLIGLCRCKSVSRNNDGTWADTLMMEWRFKYIMNGTAVQDEVWRENGLMAGSLRQYNPDSARWFVTYYTSTGTPSPLPIWEGTKTEEGEIVLYRPQQAPNGMDGSSRLTFFNITENGFHWKGEWVATNGAAIFPFWQIFCTKI